MEKEIFKPVKGFEGIYEISNFGNVYGMNRNVQNTKKSFWVRKRKIKKPSEDKDGYLRVSLYKNGKEYKRYVHRLVAESFLTNKENKPEVNHKDKNPKNNKVDNLEWVTSKENCNHKLNFNYHKNLLKSVKPVKDNEFKKIIDSEIEFKGKKYRILLFEKK